MTTELNTLREALEPCPMCGSAAHFFKITDLDDKNFGGEGVCCSECIVTTDLMFSLMDDCKPLLAEKWNRRAPRLEAAAVPVGEVKPVAITEEMVTAYLKANDAYWQRTDQQPTPPDKWRTGTPREATRESLAAALASRVEPKRAVEQSANAIGYVRADVVSKLATMSPAGRSETWITKRPNDDYDTDTPLYTTPPAPPEGWKLVPVEPTDDMLAAFADATSGAMVWDSATEDDRQSVRDGFTPGYRAMLAAAPQPGGKA